MIIEHPLQMTFTIFLPRTSTNSYGVHDDLNIVFVRTLVLGKVISMIHRIANVSESVVVFQSNVPLISKLQLILKRS